MRFGLRIAHEIGQAFFTQFGNATLFSTGKLLSGRLWKKRVEIVTIASVENIHAGHRERLAIEPEIDDRIYDRELHITLYGGQRE
jgi:hypothetical protein